MSDLTLTEQKNVRTALRYLRRRAGNGKALAEVLHFSPDTVKKVTGGLSPVTASMTMRVARLAGVTVDDLLEGRYVPGACPKCGHVPDFADEPTGVDDAPPQLGCGLTLVK